MLFIKIICACLFTAVSTYIASYVSLQYKLKGHLLNNLSESLKKMISGINHKHKPIHIIINELSAGDENWKSFYKEISNYIIQNPEAPLSEAFAFSVNLFASNNDIKVDDLAPFLSLGDSIEQSDMLFVCNSIKDAVADLEQKANEYMNYYKGKAKVYSSIGLIIGVFSSILIL